MRPLVSIIVNNYNYGRFLPHAIVSALEQLYDRCEIIVVDDGSTDDSQAVIAEFGARIVPILKPHGGQASALNAGFAHCAGDIVIFLDADDFLAPDAVERYVHAFYQWPQAARVQSRLAIVDEFGRPQGDHIPRKAVKFAGSDLRGQALRYPDDLPWAAMSGNAFPRWVLQLITPIPTDIYPNIGADIYLLNVTPLFGPIVSLDEIGGYYRAHGRNAFHRAHLDLAQTRLVISLSMATHREMARLAPVAGIAGGSGERIGQHSLTLLAHRMISKKLSPNEHPITSDTLPGICLAALKAAAVRRDRPPLSRAAYAVWHLLMAISPTPLARHLATLPFNHGARRRR
jgi:hypothetical protein